MYIIYDINLLKKKKSTKHYPRTFYFIDDAEWCTENTFGLKSDAFDWSELYCKWIIYLVILLFFFKNLNTLYHCVAVIIIPGYTYIQGTTGTIKSRDNVPILYLIKYSPTSNYLSVPPPGQWGGRRSRSVS